MLKKIGCCLFLLISFNLCAAQDPYFVGELGSSWEFASDHLPIGLTMDQTHISFWNILNKLYLGHIVENTQGLRESAIMRDNVPDTQNPPLTVRETTVLKEIAEMIHHPTHPRSLIALQETHPDVLKALQKSLPPGWQIALPPGQKTSQDIFLYDTQVFELVSLEAEKYSDQLPKTIFSLTLTEKASGKTVRFIQSHIPGGPVNSPAACAKFAEVALKQFDPSITLILMGDMNQSPSVIEKALDLAAKNAGLDKQPYRYLENPNPTHMNTLMEASWIDLFFIYTPDSSAKIQPSQPEELFDELVPIVNLLKGYAKP
jgi:hypothetical protein